MSTLKEKYKVLCEMYVEAFMRKHGLFDDETGEYGTHDWIGDDIGGILEVCDYTIGFDEIRYDIDNAIPKDTYFEYYDYRLTHCFSDRKLNYHSYVNGFRFNKYYK